uniref:Uncharacterized protein n=1 Tax=Romanomermis culicivorax TaxID=13658 RepID=A0A915KHC8_ROMCU
MDRQQLETFSLEINFRSEKIKAILRRMTDDNLQPNGTEISLSFVYIPLIAFRFVPSEKAFINKPLLASGRCNATSKLCREVICLSEQMSQIVDNISAYVEYEPPPISVDSENSASNSIFQKSYIATSSKRYILSCRRSPLNRRFPPPEYFASFFRKIISFLNGNVSEIFDKSKQADILKTKTTNMELILSQLCRQENDANVRFKEIDERLAKVRVEIRHWFESFVFELNSAIVCPNQASPDVTALFHSCMNTLIDVLDQIDNYENQVDHFSTILSELSQSVQICTQNLQSVSKMQESLCQIFASISEQTKFLDKTSNIYQMSVYKSAVGNNSQNEMMVEYFSDIYNFICSKIDNRVEERNKETLILCEIQENSAKMRQIGVDMAKKLSKVEKLIEKCRAENQNLNSTLDQCKIDKDGKRAKMKQKLLTLEARLIESLNEKEILRVEMHKVSSQTVDDQILDEKLNRRLQMYMQDIEHEDFRIAQRIESSIVARSENEGVLSNLVEKLCNKNRTLEKLSSKLSEQGNGAIQRLVDEISELKKQKRRLRKDIDKMNTKKISNAEYLKNARKENTILAAKISTTYSIDRSNLIESMKRALKVNEMLEIRLCREEKTYETIRKDLLSLQIFIKNQHSQKLGLKDPSLAEKPPMPLEMNQDERTIAPHASPFKLLNPFNNEKFLVNEQVFFEKEDDSKKCENEDTCEENSEACTKESTLTMSSKNSTHAVSTKNSQGKQDIATNRTTNVSFYSTASENTQSAIEVRDRAITKNTLHHTYCADSSIDKKFRTQYDPVAESRAVKRIFKRCSRRPAVQLFPGKP